MSDEFDAPQSRTEAALQNLLGASNELEEPQSRVEAILQNMLGADNILEPAQSREEALLLQILDQGGGGGSATLINNKDISSNGVYSASSDDADGYKKVTVSVANSYSAADEGKVVSSGALVAQTAHATVTQNGVVDTTLNNSVEVAVPQPSGTKQISITQNGTTTENVNDYASAEISVDVQSSAPDGLVNGTIANTYWSGSVTGNNKFNSIVTSGYANGDLSKCLYWPLSKPISVSADDTLAIKFSTASGNAPWGKVYVLVGGGLFAINTNTNFGPELSATMTYAGEITTLIIMAASNNFNGWTATVSMKKNGVTVF